VPGARSESYEPYSHVTTKCAIKPGPASPTFESEWPGETTWLHTRQQSSLDAQQQQDALVAGGVQKCVVFADVTSGSKTAVERPGMKKLLEYAEEGDTVAVWRVDRLRRSLIDVLITATLLRDCGVHSNSGGLRNIQ
jgi:hypothetical protein